MNKNIKMIAILAVLVILYFLTQRKDSTLDFDKDFTKLDSIAISKIVIKNTEREVVLEKGIGNWLIEGYPVDQLSIQNAVSELKNIKVTRKVTDKEARHDALEVSDSKGLNVSVYEGEDETTFILGKQGASYNNMMIRKSASDDVFSTAKNFKSILDKSVTDWKDKTIFKMSKDEIASMILKRKNGKDLYLVNKDSVVSIANESGSEFEGNWEATGIMNGFNPFNTQDFPSDVKSDFSSPDLIVEIQKRDGAKLSFFAEADPADENKYFVKLDNKEIVFRVYKSVLEKFFKSLKDLKK